MISLLGFLTIGIFLYLIMTKRLSVMIALIVVPIVFGLIGGFGLKLGAMMLEGIKQVAPTGIMLIFAVLYFGLMFDAGLFDPIIARLVRLVKGDPLKIVVGTAILTMIVHLDGDGTATFMITISALFPIYQKLGMNRLILSGVVALGAGTMHLVPWSGTVARAITVLHTDSTHIFNPLIPSLIGGMIWVLFVAYLLGRKERQRLGTFDLEYDHKTELTKEQMEIRRPHLFWFNLVLTVVLIVTLIKAWLPLPVLFMIAYSIALLVNYPNQKDQQKRLMAHGGNVIFVSSMIFAAGIFSGILTGTKMITAMATTLVSLIPHALAVHLPVLVAVTSMPLSLVFTPDAYYFGVLPILAQTATHFGIDPVQIGRAAVLGQMTVGFPLSPLTASTFLLVGLSGVELGDHQKFTFKWAFGTTIVFTIIALITGAIQL
jgi:CitMHS family citrate-Mg2+:H+ or citrate-Ca2+:H+ symporter